MKKIVILLLCLCLLLSMAACSKRNKELEKENKTYLVTLQKTMEANSVTQSANFTYDAKGRPTLIELHLQEGRTVMAQIIYDAYGNKISEIYTSNDGQEKQQQEIQYDMTYLNGVLTHCDKVLVGGGHGARMGFDLSYDANGNLVLLSYDETYTARHENLWHSFEYDDAGRLIRETLCKTKAESNQLDSLISYRLAQCRYAYSDDGKTVTFSVYTADVPTPVTADALDGIDFQPTPDLYNFCFNDSGKLFYVGSGAEDVYKNGDKTIFDSEKYKFDKYGNLLSTVQNGSGAIYGYTGFDLTRKEAEMAKRLQHGVSEYLCSFALYERIDPVYYEIGTAVLFVPMLQNPVYYLIPYPVWGIG